MHHKAQLISYIILILWWIYALIWQPWFVHTLANLSYQMDDISISRKTAHLGRERALAYATHGGSVHSDIFFTEAEVSHLIDVSHIYRPVTIGLNFFAACAWIILLATVSKKRLSLHVLQSSAKVLAILVVFLIFSLLFFSQFFIAFHQLLFPLGNWEFPENSFLILIFPELFWKNMLVSIVILLASCALTSYLLSKYLISKRDT